MSYFPDMGHRSMVVTGEHVRAIGWLHSDHAYGKGSVSEEFLTRLKEFAARSSLSSRSLYFGAFGGFHTCEFCGRAHGTGNFGVPDGGLLFVAPEMVVHYVEEHGYCPPPEFVSAVVRAPLPGTEEYALIAEPFSQMHQAAFARMMDTAKNKDRADGS